MLVNGANTRRREARSRRIAEALFVEGRSSLGPNWFGYASISLASLTGVLAGWTLARGSAVALLAVLVAVVTVLMVVRHIAWLLSVSEVIAEERGRSKGEHAVLLRWRRETQVPEVPETLTESDLRLQREAMHSIRDLQRL